MKRCSVCLLYRALDQFYRDKRRKDGLEAACKFCKRRRNRDWLRKNYASHRNYLNEFQWKRRGIELTVERYSEMLVAQNGRCAICEREPGATKLAVDHDHKTGRIRGLLCSWCNRKLVAMLEHRLFSRAQKYLLEGSHAILVS